MAKDHQIGDAPVEAHLRHAMFGVAKGIDELFNGNVMPARIGFALMVFPFNTTDGRCNYVSNAKPEDMLVVLKEQVARLEGRLQEAKVAQ